MATTDVWTESQERDECPECEHPWYLHSETQCTQSLCLCKDGKRGLWALPPDEYYALPGAPPRPEEAP